MFGQQVNEINFKKLTLSKERAKLNQYLMGGLFGK